MIKLRISLQYQSRSAFQIIASLERRKKKPSNRSKAHARSSAYDLFLRGHSVRNPKWVGVLDVAQKLEEFTKFFLLGRVVFPRKLGRKSVTYPLKQNTTFHKKCCPHSWEYFSPKTSEQNIRQVSPVSHVSLSETQIFTRKKSSERMFRTDCLDSGHCTLCRFGYLES